MEHFNKQWKICNRYSLLADEWSSTRVDVFSMCSVRIVVDFLPNNVDEFDKKCSKIFKVVSTQSKKKQQQLEKFIDKLEKRFNVTTENEEVKELRDTVLD